MEYSVLMTVYKNDNPRFFYDSLMSMVNQTKLPSEMVVVLDGAIPKELSDVLADVKTKYANIVEVPLEKNVGLGLALNEGLKVVKNELIARMDSDDISLPERCEKQVMEFESNPALDICGSSVNEFCGDVSNITGKRIVPTTNEEIHKFCRKRDPFNHPTVMYRKSKLQQVGGYGDYRKNQDTDLWIKLLSIGCVAMNFHEPLLMFRFSEDTYGKRKSWVNTKTLIKIRKNAYKIKFCSFWDYMQVMIMQMAVFILPVWFQKLVYKKMRSK